MSLFRDISAALREGLDDLLNAGATRDEVDEVTGLLEADLAEARAEIDLAHQDERRLAARLAEERREADHLYDLAKEAVDAGDDDRGRELIHRRRRALRAVEILEQQATEHQQLLAQLQDHVEALEDKLQELRLRRDYLRTRTRVQSLHERYERYQREFRLDELQGFEDEVEAGPPPAPPDLDEDGPFAAAEDGSPDRVVPVGPLVPRTRGVRLEPDAGQPEPAAQPMGGRGELPPVETDDVPFRRRPLDEPDDEEPEPPRRDYRVERERLLRDIERRTRSAAVEAEIDDELTRLKQSSGHPAPPARDEAPDGPAPDA